MLSRVDVITPSGTILELPIYESDDGYYITNIDGLDPVKANMVSSGFANLDGEQYQSSRREKRNPVISIGFDPDFATTSVRELRNYLYNFLMPKSQVKLSFVHDDGFVASINGIVEAFDSKLFVKEPEATISILCFDPDFYDNIPVVTNLTTVLGGPSDFTVIDNPATVDTGVLVKLYVNRTLSQFTIATRQPNSPWSSMQFVGSLLNLDTVNVQTIPGNKFITKVDDNNTSTSFLYALSPESTWLTLKPGINHFRITASGAPVPYDLIYSPRYGGL